MTMFFERFSFSTDGGSLYKYNVDWLRGTVVTKSMLGAARYDQLRSDSPEFKNWTDDVKARLIIM